MLRNHRSRVMLTVALMTGLFGIAAIAQQIQLQINGNVIIQKNGAGGIVVRNGRGASTLENPLFIPVDGNYQRIQKRYQELVKTENFADAATVYQRLVENESDFFVDPAATSSIKHGLDVMFKQAPTQMKKFYELEYGGEAAFLLEEFWKNRDRDKLVQAYRRYFPTKAGQKAAYLLAMNHLDTGNSLAAIRCCRRLLEFGTNSKAQEPDLSLVLAGLQYQLGYDDDARQTLLSMKEKINSSYVEFQGKKIELFGNALDARKWFAQNFDIDVSKPELPADSWPLARGNGRQNAISEPIAPVRYSDWTTRTIQASDFDDITRANGMARYMTDMINKGIKEGTPRLPAFQPIVVGDTAVIRTFGPLKAFNVHTGKQVWQTMTADEEFHYLVENMNQTPDVEPGKYRAWDLFVSYRAWKDRTTGSISSDGQRVFAIHDVGIPGMAASTSTGIYRHPLLPGDDNLLRAYDLVTGRFLWDAGGPRGDRSLDLAGTFFLGPPLAHNGKLYIIGDDSREIQLICLDPKTGEHFWSQPLVATPFTIGQPQSVDRRLLGLTPSFAQGMIVCPTGLGAVVAVDPDRVALVWKYEVEAEKDEKLTTPQQQIFMLRMRQQTALRNAQLRLNRAWADTNLVVSENHVALPSTIDDSLHLLDAATGQPVWENPRRRGHGLFVGGIDGEKLVIVGENLIESVRVSDGQDRWPAIPISQPTGRGIRTGGLFHQPVYNPNKDAKGEVVTVDLQSGRILARTSNGGNRVAGNLAAASGMIVSCSPIEAYSYNSVSQLEEQLAKEDKQETPESLALRGEIQLHLGNETKALEYLRRAHKAKPTPNTAGLIAGTLLEGLRVDYENYKPFAEEIRSLLTTDSQVATYIRLYADGLHQSGQLVKAFELYLDFVNEQKLGKSLERIDGKRIVRIDRWVQNELHQILNEASDEDRTKLEASIQRIYDQTKASDDVSRLKDFVSMFSKHPLAINARWELVDRLDVAKNPLEVESTLNWLSTSAKNDNKNQVLLKQVELDLARKRFQLATRRASMIGQQAPKSDASVQLAAIQNLSQKNEDFADAITRREQWPAADYSTKMIPKVTSTRSKYPIAIYHRFNPEFERTYLSMDTRSREITAEDEYGRVTWSVAIHGQYSFGSYSTYYAHTYGDLHAVALFGNLFMIRAGHDGKPAKVLWTRSLRDAAASTNATIRSLAPQANGNPPALQDGSGDKIGRVSAFQADYICYQSGSDLYAVDPVTGETLWAYEDTPPGANLIVSKDFVFVEGEDDRQVIINATDGSFVQERLSPFKDVDYRQNGYQYFVTERNAQQVRLTGYRPIPGDTDEMTYEYVFPVDSFRRDCADHLSLVVDGDGKIQLLNPYTGEKRFSAQLNKSLGPFLKTTVFCREDLDHVYVMVQKPHTPEFQKELSTSRYSGMDRFNKYTMIHGPIICFDRQTGVRKWEHTVKNDGLLLNQPKGLPCLIFGTNIYGPYKVDPTTKRRTRLQESRYLLLNKYTGDVMLDEIKEGKRDMLGNYATNFEKGEFKLIFGQVTVDVRVAGETPEQEANEDESKPIVPKTYEAPAPPEKPEAIGVSQIKPISK